MAETFTEAGANYTLNQSWRVSFAGSLATIWVGLFTSNTPTTVPASTASGASAGWTEITAATGTYARQSITASAISAFASVGASSWGGNFPQVTFTGFTQTASPANGYGVFAASTSGASGSPLFFSNFNSGASYAFATSSASLLVTPAIAALP